MPDIREEFEEYIAVVREAVKAKGFKPLDDAIEKWMFHAWQASRAALLKDHVPMPRQCPSWLEDAYDDEACRDKHYIDGLSLPGYEAMLKAQEEVLQQAGIEVI